MTSRRLIELSGSPASRPGSGRPSAAAINRKVSAARGMMDARAPPRLSGRSLPPAQAWRSAKATRQPPHVGSSARNTCRARSAAAAAAAAAEHANPRGQPKVEHSRNPSGGYLISRPVDTFARRLPALRCSFKRHNASESRGLRDARRSPLARAAATVASKRSR